MSYSTEIVKQNVERDMLVLLRPKMRITDWSIFAGTIYRKAFPFGYVTGVSVNGTALALGPSAAGLAAGQFFYDSTGLYIRKTSTRTPVFLNSIVVDANNNTIRFTEGAGTFSAIIASGTYTTYASFYAAVVAAFNSAVGHAAVYSLGTGNNAPFTDDQGFTRFTVASTGGTFLVKGTDAAFTARELLGYAALDLNANPQTFVLHGDFITATYELYLSTREGYFGRDPLDANSLLTQWRGVIQPGGSPSVTMSSDDSVLGFIPIQSTFVSVANDAAYFEQLLQDSSFNQTECILYHLAGKDQIKKIFTGITDAPTVTDQSITIPILDKSYNIDQPVNNGASDELFPFTGGTDGTGADPAFSLQPIRQLYGYWRGIRLVCTDAEINAPTTAVNRKWVLMTQQHGVNYFSAAITAVDGFTKTVTVAVAKKIAHYFAMGGRKIAIDGNLRDLQAVDVDAGTFRIATVFLGGTVMQTVPVGNDLGVYLVRDATFYRLDLNTHYSFGAVGPNGGFGIVLAAGVEAAYGIAPNINPTTDAIYCDAFGYDAITGTVDDSPYNPVVVLYWILTQVLGLTTVDTATFQALASTSKSRCGLSIPSTTSGSFPSVKEVVNLLLTADFLQGYFNENGNFTIKRIGLMGAADLSVTDDEISEPSWEYVYRDLSSVRVVSGIREFLLTIKKGGSTVTGPFVNDPNHFQMDASYNYEANRYLHGGGKESRIETAFMTADYKSETLSPTGIHWTGRPVILNEIEYAKRISQIVGERGLRLSCVIKVGAHELNVGSIVQLTRKKLPGFIYDGSTQSSKKFRIVDIAKEVGQVRVTMTDQKGIEDNVADWG